MLQAVSSLLSDPAGKILWKHHENPQTEARLLCCWILRPGFPLLPPGKSVRPGSRAPASRLSLCSLRLCLSSDPVPSGVRVLSLPLHIPQSPSTNSTSATRCVSLHTWQPWLSCEVVSTPSQGQGAQRGWRSSATQQELYCTSSQTFWSQGHFIS